VGQCNRRKIAEDPALGACVRDLYQTPGIGDTINLAHIKHHPYRVHTSINRSGIVPVGPDLDWARPHGRDALGGSPFGAGTAPTTDSDLSTYRLEPAA
jgi:glutathionyl-hydroquinone reductase